MKSLVALAISVAILAAQEGRVSLRDVTAVRTWSLPDVTRVAIEVTGSFDFKYDRLHNPERVYFDMINARPRIEGRKIWSRTVKDKLVAYTN